MQTRQLVMFRYRIIDMIAEQHIRLAGFNPGRQHPNPQRARGQSPLDTTVMGAEQRPFLIIFHRPHEGI